MNEQPDIIYVVKKNTYAGYTLPELKMMRANMISRAKSPAEIKFSLAHIQYWIMVKEGRLPPPQVI